MYERCLHLSDTFAYRSAHGNLFLTLRVIHKLKNSNLCESHLFIAFTLAIILRRAPECIAQQTPMPCGPARFDVQYFNW